LLNYQQEEQALTHSVLQAVILVQVFTIPQPVLVLVKLVIHSWLVIIHVPLIVQVISSEHTQLIHAIFVTPVALLALIVALMDV
jgi:hypothetical protein